MNLSVLLDWPTRFHYFYVFIVRCNRKCARNRCPSGTTNEWTFLSVQPRYVKGWPRTHLYRDCTSTAWSWSLLPCHWLQSKKYFTQRCRGVIISLRVPIAMEPSPRHCRKWSLTPQEGTCMHWQVFNFAECVFSIFTIQFSSARKFSRRQPFIRQLILRYRVRGGQGNMFACVWVWIQFSVT